MMDRWDKIDETRVIKLWNDGYTGLQIARELKTTRSAILGKIARLRRNGVTFEREYKPLSEREKVVKVPKPPRKIAIKMARLPKAVEAPVVLVAPKPAAYMGRSIPFKSINNKTCKFVVSGDLPKDFLFCGDPVYKKSFCEHHYKLCYNYGGINDDAVAA